MIKWSKVLVRLLLFVVATFISISTFAQLTEGEKNDVMRSHDKIYVVMAICLTILLGLVVYAIRIDRKINNLEKGK